MKQKYAPEYKNKILRLHLEDGLTLASLHEEYGVSKVSVSNLVNQ